ncbi:MAG: glycosyltransferase family 39 protein [Nanoarchaeota archaeon]|nr:glycosyltransferase family 39 protein [Nanoarchaeota archaeon]
MNKSKIITKTRVILLSIFLFTIAIRLILAFSVPNLTYDSYYHLGHVENIMETGVPLYEDPLSYGGRELRFLPLFHYFAALLMFIFPFANEISAKIISNILFACLPLVIYLIAKKISKQERAPLFSALVAAFLPINFQTNSFSPLPFALLLIFTCIYFYLNFNLGAGKRYLYFYLISLILLLMSSSLASVLIFSLIFYVGFSKLENKSLSSGELELTIFSSFFFLWAQFIFFKDTFLNEGISFIWQNIPSSILVEYFPKVNLITALLLLGIIPFITALYLTYTSVFKERNKDIILIICIAITISLLTWFRLVPLLTALSFLGLVVAVLFAPFYDKLIDYYQKTRFNKRQVQSSKVKLTNFRNCVGLILTIILLLTLLWPAVTYALDQDTPTDQEVVTFSWLKDNSPEDTVILSSLKEGHLVTYYADRKNVMDTTFELIPDIEVRFAELNSMYTSYFQTQVIGIADKYDIRYLVLTSSTKEHYNISKFEYLNKDCFDLQYNEEDNRIYQLTCTLKIEE